MAKNKEDSYKFPSHFGSHSSMLDHEATDLQPDQNFVVLNDEFGQYITERSKLDSGLADPNRYKEKRLSKLFARKEEKVKNE